MRETILLLAELSKFCYRFSVMLIGCFEVRDARDFMLSWERLSLWCA